MKTLITTVVLALFFQNLCAQINQGGQPYQWSDKTINPAFEFIEMPGIDLLALQAEDEVVDSYKETPYRFGVDKPVDIDIFEDGNSETLSTGEVLWTLGIYCPKATSINFVFGEYSIPEGGQVYVYNHDRSRYLGAFTEANMKDFGGLAVGVLHTDRIIIEYKEPAGMAGLASLKISQVTHGYREIIQKNSADKGPFGLSQSCNININCSIASDWQQEKRGVGLLLTGGFLCSGTLVNNTENNGIPYVLTANHCGGDESNLVMYFNHEYNGCSNVGSSNTSQSISGASVMATTVPSDGHLIQLSQDVPLSYDPYYNGWDRSNSAVSSAVGIHHPAGDVKKISFDHDAIQKTFYGGSNPLSSGNYWRVIQWDENTTTEGGSSGSPLFDQNHRIVGLLSGGGSACNNNLSDWYGATDKHLTAFSNFLDPTNSGANVLDGYDPNNAGPGTVQFSIKAILEGPYVSTSQLMKDDLSSGDFIPLNEPYTALGYTHIGSGGGETTTNAILDVIGNNAIVDWVFVELRSSADPSIVIATQSALIQRDGDIVSASAGTAINFPSLTANDVYIAIKHRNHFGIRSAGTFPTTSPISINFTSTSTSVFGGDAAMKTIGSKKVIYAGDANGDGQVNSIDKNGYWQVENGGAFDYINTTSDFDLNGAINTIDKNGYWQVNNSNVEILD